MVPRESIPEGFDYVAAGHIHQHQVLRAVAPGGPPIVYPGSLDRVNFAEIDEPKGYIIAGSNGAALSPRFVEHDVRPMAVLPIDAKESSLELAGALARQLECVCGRRQR